MTRAAGALATPTARSTEPAGPRPHLERRLADLNGDMRQRRFTPGRAHLVLLAIVVASAWLVVVFANTLGSVDRATARQRAVAAETQALEQRLAAGRRELALVQTDSFQLLQARSFGMGAPGEQVFSLAPGAPDPEPIVPLGQESPPTTPASPLDAWLELLFGS